jgi:4-hydroxy-tetrahydrodipicolinate synthase
VIRGVKDSGGDWTYSRELLEAHGDLSVLIGDERHLARAIVLGAKGSISGTANIFPEILLPVIKCGQEDDRINRTIDEILKFPVTPAVKALLAHMTGENTWLRVSPPLQALTPEEMSRLVGAYEDI